MYILLEKRILIFKKLYTMLFFKKCFYKKEYESLFTLHTLGIKQDMVNKLIIMNEMNK